METLFYVFVSNALTSAVLALAVACAARPLSRRPAVLHGLWLLVLLKLVTPPLYEVTLPRLPSGRLAAAPALEIDVPTSFPLAEPMEAPTELLIDTEMIAVSPMVPGPPPVVEDRAAPPAKRPVGIDWARTLTTIWLVGSALVLIISCLRIRRFQRWLGPARPAPDEIQSWVEGWADRMGLRRGRAPVVTWARGRFSPMVWPLGRRPRLILPRDLWKSLDERQRSAVIVHELAHLRRGDHRVRFFELIVTALYWWDPVVWLARHALRDVEEQCCDAWVVWALPGSARAYAESLLEALDFLSRSDHVEPLLASGFGKAHHLRRRLTMIMTGTTNRLPGVPGALSVLGLAAVLLPLSASWAQKPEKQGADTVAVQPAGPDFTLAKVEQGDKPKHETDDADESDTKEIKFHFVTRLQLTDEQKAEVKKLEARIKKLHKGLLESQKNLMEAYGELAKLKGVPMLGEMGGMGMGGMMPGAMMSGGMGMMPGGMGGGMMPGGMMGGAPGAMMSGGRGGMGMMPGMMPGAMMGKAGGADLAKSIKPGANPHGPGSRAFTFTAVSSKRKDEERIDKLEKTLEKVLKELEGLKHDQSKD